jgi:hypothetical protein
MYLHFLILLHGDVLKQRAALSYYILPNSVIHSYLFVSVIYWWKLNAHAPTAFTEDVDDSAYSTLKLPQPSRV